MKLQKARFNYQKDNGKTPNFTWEPNLTVIISKLGWADSANLYWLWFVFEFGG